MAWQHSKARRLVKDYAVAALHPSRSRLGRLLNGLTDNALARNTKLHIHPRLSIAAFFAELDRRGVRYVVLRWFDDLPEVEPGHDIDILVADDAAGRIEDLLTLWPRGQRIDIYTESGVGGYGFKAHTAHEMSAYPPQLASEMLEEAVRINGTYSVPGMRHRFLCLAYHAVYLKAQDSGLRSTYTDLPKGKAPSHDYAQVLEKMAKDADITLPANPSLEDIDAVLGAHGWRPPPDTLDRISVWSAWVARHFAPASVPDDLPPGLTVFFVRDRAVTSGYLDEIQALLDRHGFEILASRTLEGAEQDAAEAGFRGGNWGKGPYPISGGAPKCILAAVDVFPCTVSADVQKKQPLLGNARILEAKKSVRDFVFRTHGGPRFNALHSTDNATQALETLHTLFPDEWTTILGAAKNAVEAVRLKPPAIRVLSGQRRRAQVELISHEGAQAVRKVFRRNKSDFLEREVAAMQALSASPHTPRLLGHDERSLLMEFVRDDWGGQVPTPMGLAQVQQLSGFMSFCCAAGLDPIDLMPGKNLVCHDGQITVLDFEFCYQRKGLTRPDELYALSGVPQDFDDPLPIDTPSIRSPYGRKWFPFTGMDLHVFLHGTPRQQRMAHMLNRPRILLRQKTLAVLVRSKLGRALLRHIKSQSY